jgi:hypothetical protein
MEIFGGLFLYEIVLLVLGNILFFVLLGLLIFAVIKKRDIKLLVGLFLMPVVMIGFPSIQKIRYDNGVLEIEKEAQHVKSSPQSAEIKKDLASKVENLQSRAESNPAGLVAIADAHLALGDTLQARRSVDAALKIRPDHPRALILRRNIGQR